MNPDLLEQLRKLYAPSAPTDVTATLSRQLPASQPTIGPRTGTRMPLPEPGILAAIQRSAEPSPDTPSGMLNEMFNPIRAGSQARELAGKAAGAVQRGELGRAAGYGALMAMAVPGVPGPDDAARPFGRTVGALGKMDELAARLEAETEAMRMLSGPQAPLPRMIENPEYNALWDELMRLSREANDASQQRSSARRLLREGEEWRGDLEAAGREYVGGKDRARALRELMEPLRERLRKTERYIPEQS